MSLMHENRLDNTVNGGDLGYGEEIEVKTKMGKHVVKGTVQSVTPFGVIIKEEGSEQERFYKTDFYLFTPMTKEPETKVANVLIDMSLDARVEAKLKSMGEAGDPSPESSGAAKIEPGADEKGERDKEKGKEEKPEKPEQDDADAGKKDDEKKDKEPEKKKEKKDDDKPPAADTGSAVNVDDLPDDIRDAIVSSKEMDEGQLNSVLGEISDAAMKGLKRSNVKETEIFGLVQQIQDATYEVLTGKKKGKE